MYNFVLKKILLEKKRMLDAGEDDSKNYEDLTIIETHVRSLKKVRAGAGQKTAQVQSKKAKVPITGSKVRFKQSKRKFAGGTR